MTLNPKKFLLLLLTFPYTGHSFSQSTTAGNSLLSKQTFYISYTVAVSPDTVPAKFPGLISASEKNLLSSFNKKTGRSFTDSARSLKKSLLNTAESIYRNPFKMVNGNISYEGLGDSSYLYAGKNYYFSNFTASSKWIMAGIPVEINYQNELWSEIDYNDHSRFSARFDRNNYLEEMKKKLGDKLNPAALSGKLIDPLQQAKDEALRGLQNDLHMINEQYKQLLDQSITKIGAPAGLLNKDVSALREQLLNNDYVSLIKQNENLYSQLVQKRNLGEKVDSAQLAALENSLLQLKGTQALITKIEEHKHRWESSGLIRKLKESDLLQKEKLRQLINDPATIIRSAKQNLKLTGLQKLFLKIEKLDMGKNAFSSSSLSLQHFLNNGVVTKFSNAKSSLMLLAGKQTDYNSILDLPFVNNIFSNTGFAKSVSAGSFKQSSSHSQVTIASYDQTLSSINLPAALASFRRILVTTISREVQVGEKGLIAAEISRSATDYPASGPDNSGKNGLKRIFSAEDFWKNTAFSLKYEDEFSKSGLSYQVHFSKTPNGYNNPGNLFLNTGSQEIGYNLKKTWKKTFQFSTRMMWREFRYNDERPEKWRSLYSVADFRWKMKKGQYIAFRYMPNKMTRLDANGKSKVTALNHLSMDANLTGKIAGLRYRNYSGLAFQKNGYVFGHEWILAKSVLLTSSQVISIGNYQVYLNTNYNYSDNASQYVYFNSSLVSEAGSSYMLWKKITATSSLTYNSINGWYRQVGIRQTVAARIGERFNMNLFIDARKNIKVYQPLLYGLLRAELNISYQLKN